ncbi:MAG TPA: TetR/AcrR family transcriptional regulator [Lachnospiraceae bacterium]|nr:TetR/AcrR family transcriptional regulator [Lachnospiraceae bacterium]
METTMSTKDKIIYESLKLFSTNGYEAVSTRMIARAVGVSGTAIYKHFKSKQEIFDTIISTCKERFICQRKKVDYQHICWEDLDEICMNMFRFQTQDEWIVMFRKILVVEQFKNPEIAKLYQAFFIDIALGSMKDIFEWLIKEGYMVDKNPRVLAMELYAPFFMYHTLNPNSEEVLEELREHVKYFRQNVRKTDAGQ